MLHAPWPSLGVSVARYFGDEKVLRLEVSAAGRTALPNATLLVGLAGRRVDNVTFVGGFAGSWSEVGGALEIVVSVNGTLGIDVWLR